MKKMTRRAMLMSSAAVAGSVKTLSAANAQPASLGPDALKSTLTPLGGIRAGNAEGTIPAWTGELIPFPADYQSGAPRPDPFADEKPILTITSANMAAYQDKLANGAIELLQRFPDYRIDVYPTHRTAIAPQYVYDNTYKNAANAQIAPDGNSISGAYGGIPFPIPTTGKQVMWNHLLAWKGTTIYNPISSYQVTSSGQKINRATGHLKQQYPYYFEGEEASFDGIYEQIQIVVAGPAYEEGSAQLILQQVNPIQNPTRAWAYLPGERRTRLAPELQYDTPIDVAGGVANFDEAHMFSGPLDEYDCKLLGKKEMYVPYNMNTAWATPVDQQFGAHFYNPDITRWELHRVWVVEMTLAAGKRNVDVKRLMYLDEDVWSALLCDIYDASGTLWKFMTTNPGLASDIPCQVAAEFQVVYDFHAGDYAALGVPIAPHQWAAIPRLPASYFTAGELAALAGNN